MQGTGLRLERLSDRAYLLSPIFLIASFYLPLLALLAFVPLFFSIESKDSLKLSAVAFFPFLLFIYSGVFKSLYVYYGLVLPIAVLLYFALMAYHFIYLFLPVFLYRKLGFSIYLFPILFTASEVLKDKLFYGFPVGDISMLIYNVPFLIKPASYLGSSFITLEVLFINAVIYGLLKRKMASVFILIIVGVFLLLPSHRQRIDGYREIAIVQGNIPQSQKWDDRYLQRNLQIYISETRKIKGDVVFWPESAYPYLFTRFENPLFDLAKHFALVVGVIRKKDDRYYNSVAMIHDSRIIFYNKQKLVPFAEFIPLRSIIGRFIPGVFDPGDFSRGKGDVLFKYRGLKIGPMICYEEAFEEISRKYKWMGANLLAVLTNDAWFDGTPTFFMLNRNAVYRAVENGIWLVRVANTGVSEVINPDGRIVAKLPVDKRLTLRFRLPLDNSSSTIYDRFGYVFSYLIVVVAIFLIFYRAYKC